MPVILIQSEDHFSSIINDPSGSPFILADFYAEWCRPCQAIAPKLINMSENYKNVTFVKVNIELTPTLSDKYDVASLPTFLVFKNGDMTPLYSPIIGADLVKIENMLKMLNMDIKDGFGDF